MRSKDQMISEAYTAVRVLLKVWFSDERRAFFHIYLYLYIYIYIYISQKGSPGLPFMIPQKDRLLLGPDEKYMNWPNKSDSRSFHPGFCVGLFCWLRTVAYMHVAVVGVPRGASCCSLRFINHMRPPMKPYRPVEVKDCPLNITRDTMRLSTGTITFPGASPCNDASPLGIFF